ncbi:hypothetical protein BDEG_21293 [Batrachochytrium dendrobatidis JEL423]|uniref:Uncharacterized protein n=1 Tax=Batrachochytrium dendrobatidis (strain JEL423) TaxID=403673 RepID=A0A177WAW5_BATDL|nr:hypothetical protein BDEG_21293 [Batrachochytrium dendrobatidis JEL423]
MQQFESIPGNPSLMMRKGSEHEFCIERGSRPSSTQNGSRRSYVSSVSGLDNDKSIDKQYTMLGTTESCKSERTHFYGQSHSKTDESVELLPKPLTYIPLSYIKVQTARTNLDRYRIEQIALKRLSALPDGLVQRFFGPSFTTIHSLRVLLLQSIDSARRYRQRVANRTSYIAGIPVMQQEGAILNTHELCSELVQSSTITAPLCRTHSSSNSHGLILAGEKQVTNTAAIKQHSQTLHTLRKEIRTPQEILSILEQVDKTLEKETTKGKMIQLRRRRKNAKAFEMGGYGGSLDASSHGMASIQRNHFCENQLDSLRLAGPAGLSSHSQKPVSRKKTAGVYIEDPPLAPNEDITKPQTPLIPIPPKKKCTPKVLAAENILKMYERNKQSKYAF